MAFETGPKAIEPGLQFLLVRRGEIRAQDRRAAGQRARVDQEVPIAIINPRAGAGRRDEPAQQWSDAFGVDREFEGGPRFLGHVVALARRKLQQPFGIDRDRIGIDRRRGGDCRGDDLALGREALHARIDQSGAKLVEIEETDEQRDKAAEIEHDDAPRQRRGQPVLDGARELARTHTHRPYSAGRRPARDLDVGCLLNFDAHKDRASPDARDLRHAVAHQEVRGPRPASGIDRAHASLKR